MCRSSSSLLHDPGLFSFSIYFFQLFCSTSCKSNDSPSNLDWSNPVSSRKHNLKQTNRNKTRERETNTHKTNVFRMKKSIGKSIGKTRTQRNKKQNEKKVRIKKKKKFFAKLQLRVALLLMGIFNSNSNPKSRIANSIPTRLIRERGKRSWWE